VKESKKILLAVIITFLITLSVCAFVGYMYVSQYDYPFEKLEKVMSVIENSYVGEYSFEECEEGAINGLIESLGDNYAVYYNEETAKETFQMIEGYYIGIGVEVFANMEKGYIEVISAFEDSPADKAGIINGDLIKAVDGTEYDSTQLAEAVLYMKGTNIEDPLNKVMKITLIRGGEELTVELKREQIDMYKVSHEVIDNICYIRYSGFSIESYEVFKNIIKNLDSDVEGIVIDLRNNPGGEFGSSINMCNLFIDGDLIMYTVDKSGEKREYFATNGSCELPLAVLVNGSSASASEIVAGSLQANGRAIIVGEKTYGKGVSQSVMYLNPYDQSEGALKLTTCKNYTPDGKWINEAITPDIIVENTVIGNDIRSDAAFIEAVKSLKKDK